MMIINQMRRRGWLWLAPAARSNQSAMNDCL
jgi:hypothetical protein